MDIWIALRPRMLAITAAARLVIARLPEADDLTTATSDRRSREAGPRSEMMPRVSLRISSTRHRDRWPRLCSTRHGQFMVRRTATSRRPTQRFMSEVGPRAREVQRRVNHADLVALLKPASRSKEDGRTLGGGGAFTLALAIAGPARTSPLWPRMRSAVVIGQDRDARGGFHKGWTFTPSTHVMATASLSGTGSGLESVRDMCAPVGRLIVVEYSTDRGNLGAYHSIPEWAYGRRRAGCRGRAVHSVPAVIRRCTRPF